MTDTGGSEALREPQVCPRCLRVLDEDDDANVACSDGSCDPATADELTDEIMLTVQHCDEEPGPDGRCNCGYRVHQILATLLASRPLTDTSGPVELHGWPVVRGVTCVVCPGCAFTFDADHEDDTPAGGYSCPVCLNGFQPPEWVDTPERETSA